MKQHKTKEDYRLETRFDPVTGRETRVPVYTGKYAVLAISEGEKNKKALALLLLCILWWGIFLWYLFLGTPSTSCLYVLPVISCAVFPAMYWGLGAFVFLRAPVRMTSTKLETGIARVRRSAAGCAVLSCMSVVGDAVLVLSGAGFVREGTGLLLLCLLAALGMCCAREASGVLSGMRLED